jgi:hypothetical protein
MQNRAPAGLSLPQLAHAAIAAKDTAALDVPVTGRDPRFATCAPEFGFR